MTVASMRGISVFRMDEYESFSEVDLHELVRADPPPWGGGVSECHMWSLGIGSVF